MGDDERASITGRQADSNIPPRAMPSTAASRAGIALLFTIPAAVLAMLYLLYS